MSDELERLKADLEVLERYQAYSITENAIAELADKIASIEAPKDPWAEAKQWIEKYRNVTTDPATKRQIAYTDHLNAEVARLTERVINSENIVRRLAKNEVMTANDWWHLVMDAKEIWAEMQREAKGGGE